MKNLDAIYFAVRELAPEDRPAYLTKACAGDHELRARVKQMLAVSAEAEAFITDLPDDESEDRTSDNGSAKSLKLDLADAPDEAVGQTLGRYKLLERVGEGGCGVVYVAEQTEPVRRRVALKVIKLGMDTKQVVARFEAERQALAMMDHPNIAKVLDAGTTDVGRPFFVMELVRGIKITDYCDQANLTTRERLDLFIKVCQAIQHAHQKGIIHRDIKPSNILVTLHDGVPVPKVIDFGIAKATEGRLTDATVYTQLHQFIGTPAYMSPEQAEMSGLDIDTRSDIYSLGVLLYELLAGSTPFDAKELVASGIDAMRKTIREKEPMRPSTRVATLGADEPTTTAKRRSADTSKLLHQLKGDLDWIVMKCLEKDRTRRYETANGVAADLKRHLDNEPVVARPPSAAYKFQKAFRRSKLVFTAGMVVLAALAAGIAVSAWQAMRAKRAEALALHSRSDAEELAFFMLEDFYAELEPSGQFETVARLARQAVAYYDRLPPKLRTLDTDRNRATAQARLALVNARQGDLKTAAPAAEEALARLEEIRKQAGPSEATIFALGLASEARYSCYNLQSDSQSQRVTLEKGAEVLRPFANAADGSRRVKLQYANLLNSLSHLQPPEQGVVTCEEALRVLAGLGALNLSDLAAASAWADIADSAARHALSFGGLDYAERMEKQVQTLSEGVLKRRPSDLRARLNLCFTPDVLSTIEAMRFHDAEALRLANEALRMIEDYLRFNPSDATESGSQTVRETTVAALLHRAGRVGEGLHKAREAVRTAGDERNIPVLWAAIAKREAQRGDREAADQAVQEGRRSLEAMVSRFRTPERNKELWIEYNDHAERKVRLACGEESQVITSAREALVRLAKLKEREMGSWELQVLLLLQRQALNDAAQAAVKLRRFAEAETAARSLLSLPLVIGQYPERLCLDQPDDPVWARVLLAEALAGQGRPAEGLKTLQSAVAYYRDTQVQGATHVSFYQRFARALYVQALAEPLDNGGETRRRDSLKQATALLQNLTDEARQLHDSKELLTWIVAAQKRLGQETPQP